MNSQDYDLLVIGGGPGGYTAAIRGAKKGLKTVLVERQELGGTCLNRGCIPTKTLLEDTHMISSVRDCHFMRGDMKINLKRIVERKNSVVEGSRSWIRQVLIGNRVSLKTGEAFFTDSHTVVSRNMADEDEQITASKILVASGAETYYGPGLEANGKQVLTTSDALSLETVPRSIAIVGAGNRGVELACIYNNLGSNVMLIEKNRHILPRIHSELGSRCKKALIDRRIKVLTNTTVVELITTENAEGVGLVLQTAKSRDKIQVNSVLLTGVRRPALKNLGLEKVGLSLQDGIMQPREGLETTVRGLYVVGDAAGPPFSAHKAIAQAMVAVDHMVGIAEDKQPSFIPDCVFGNPEIASIGLSEEDAAKEGRRVKVGEFHFVGNGRAGTMGNQEGTVLVVSDSDAGKVLGVHMIGPQVTELISLASLAMQNGIDVSGIKRTVFPHPTLSETFFEAALATHGEAIHLLVQGEELEPSI